MSVVCSVYSKQANDNKNCVLPTFTCKIGTNTDVRVLLDSGCQTNFILQSIVAKNDFPVVSDAIFPLIKGRFLLRSGLRFSFRVLEVPEPRVRKRPY